MAHCRKKGSHWYYRLTWTDENGTHRAERVGGDTKTECLQAWRAAMVEIQQRAAITMPKNMTFRVALNEWLKKSVRVNGKPATIDSYASVVKNHLVPDLGDVPIKKMTSRRLQDWLNEKRTRYSRSTVHSFFAVLRSAFVWLVNNRQYLADNPMARVTMPKFDELPKKVRIFTQDEMQAIFARFPSSHRFHLPIALAYYAGLRLGECLALTWDGVDLEKGTLTITSTMYDKTGLPTRARTPKSSHAARTITFGHKLKKELIQKQWQQKEARFQAGVLYKEGPDGGYVCDRGDGGPMTSNNLKYFGMWCKEQFGSGSFHCLRHTHATMLREQGVGLDYIASRLGHSSMYTTAKYYDAITDKREKEVVELIDKVF